MEARVVGAEDFNVLASVAADVFDEEVDSRWVAEFLADSY